MRRESVPYLVQAGIATQAGDDAAAKACLERGMQAIGREITGISNSLADVDKPLLVACMEMYAAVSRAELEEPQIKLVENIKENFGVVSITIPLGKIFSGDNEDG